MLGSQALLLGQQNPPAAGKGANETIVAFGAHPADVVGNCGGTLLKHALRGDRVIAVPLTLGLGHLWKPSKGSFGTLHDETTAQLKTVAQAKQFYTGLVQSCYAALQPVELHLLDLKDSPLVLSTENIWAVAEVLRRFQPSIVLTHHPTMPILAGHPDHRDAGELVLRAIMLAMEETFHESEYPIAVASRVVCYSSSDTWKKLGQADSPNLFVDVSETAAAKDQALINHKAFGGTMEARKNDWKQSAQPGYPNLEAFVQLRPIVVDYLRSNPGRPWLSA